MNLEIKPVSPGIIDDYLEFFDHTAFSDNPGWAGCYCYFHHFEKPVQEWVHQTAEENRSAAVRLIKSGVIKGYMAFVDGKPAGWCNANRKTGYTLLTREESASEHDKGICAIVCFLVAPEYRRKGIAAKLLDRVVADCLNQGYEAVEAYPAKNAEGDAHNYHGPMAMYLSAGFAIVSTGKDHDVVRKNLR